MFLLKKMCYQKWCSWHKSKLSLWTEEESIKFNEAVRLCRKNYLKITEHIGTKTRHQVRQKILMFVNRYRRQPDTKVKDVYEILTKSKPDCENWSYAEKENLLAALRKVGSDYDYEKIC